MRLATLCVWLAVAGALIYAPDLGLRLLWGILVPVVPAVLVFAPGLWRQICPMAAANQTPRRLGFSLGRALPAFLDRRAFSIAFFTFVVFVSWRAPYFNHVGWATGVALLASLALAFLGGWVFKGRSGWCGTFCPIGPVQRVYGQAPVVDVPQSYCQTCVGCQKNCYDFSPKAAVFDDMYDEDPRYAGEHRLFYAMLPGLLLGYFLAPYDPATGYPIYAAKLLATSLASVGVYQFTTSFFPVNPYRGAAAFAAVALSIFYYFMGPVALANILHLMGEGAPPEWAESLSSGLGGLCGGVLLLSGLFNERKYRQAWYEAREAAAAGVKRTHWVVAEGQEQPLRADHNQTLLSALAGSGCGISGQCGAGQCGADAVEVLDGLGNLTPAGLDELATLARLGHGPTTRLACCARVRGPVSLRPLSTKAEAPEPARAPMPLQGGPFLFKSKLSSDRIALAVKPSAPVEKPKLDRARLVGLRHVLVIGNGVAGETVVEELRKASSTVGITMFSRDTTRFYNRIAIGKIVAGSVTPEQLELRPQGWHAENGVSLRLGVGVETIDRARQKARLSDGRELDYDKIVLATGARPRLPIAKFLDRENGFVLHSAADAARLRRFIEDRAPRTAFVAGGGVLAVETAEILARAGLKTTLACRSRHLLPEVIDEESAAILTRYLERLGVTVSLGVDIFQWRGRYVFGSVLLNDGRVVESDIFVACIGSEPNVELAKACGLDVRRGVVVDETMATSDPDIFAVGDVAERQGRPSGLWSTAAAGGRTAAAALLGTPMDHVPTLARMKLKSDGIELRAFGSLRREPHDEVIVAPPFEAAWWRVVLRDGVIVGAVNAGPPGSASPLWSLVQSAAMTEDHAQALRDGNLDELEVA